MKLLNLIFMFKKPNKYCKGEKQPSPHSPVSDRKGECGWVTISPPSLSPNSLKSKAACSNSNKQHEYLDYTIVLFHTREKKTESAFFLVLFICLGFFIFNIIQYLHILSWEIFHSPLPPRVLKLKHSFNHLFLFS